MNRQAQAGCRILVTAADAPVASGRTRLHLPWLHVASRSIRVEQGGEGLVFQREKPRSHLVEVLPADQLVAFLR